jgi:hypothetical protein
MGRYTWHHKIQSAKGRTDEKATSKNAPNIETKKKKKDGVSAQDGNA